MPDRTSSPPRLPPFEGPAPSALTAAELPLVPATDPAPDVEAVLRQVSGQLAQLLELQAPGRLAPLQVDIEGASTLTGLAPRTIDKLLSSGRFPKPHKVGSRRMWRVDDLAGWVAAGCPPLSAWAARQAARERTRELNAVAQRASARKGQQAQIPA